MNKKVLRIIVILLILAFLLVPIRFQYLDGGSVEYKAFLYSIMYYNQMTSLDQSDADVMYKVGKEIKILGRTIYENTHIKSYEDSDSLWKEYPLDIYIYNA